MARLAGTGRLLSSLGRIVILGACAAAAGAAVWFVGFDAYWALAAVLSVGSVGPVLARLGFEDDAKWDQPGGETPRGIKLVMVTLEQSLAACDRLARLPAMRWMSAVLITERDDRMARATVVRRMRALLSAERHDHTLDNTIGHVFDRALDPVDRSAAVFARFGPDALTILQPNDGPPVTTAAIARCLDVIERLDTETRRSS